MLFREICFAPQCASAYFTLHTFTLHWISHEFLELIVNVTWRQARNFSLFTLSAPVSRSVTQNAWSGCNIFSQYADNINSDISLFYITYLILLNVINVTSKSISKRESAGNNISRAISRHAFCFLFRIYIALPSRKTDSNLSFRFPGVIFCIFACRSISSSLFNDAINIHANWDALGIIRVQRCWE